MGNGEEVPLAAHRPVAVHSRREAARYGDRSADAYSDDVVHRFRAMSSGLNGDP